MGENPHQCRRGRALWHRQQHRDGVPEASAAESPEERSASYFLPSDAFISATVVSRSGFKL